LNEVSKKLEEASYSFFPPGLVEQLEFSLAHNLQEVSRIHLFGALSDFDDTETLRRIVYVYIFAAIAVFILLLACINFMNLSTARYAKRMKEVGMRKILGADRSVLIKQFMGESVFYTLISLLTAVVLAELFLPTFNNLLEVKLNLIDFDNPVFLLVLLGLGLLVGIISGSYPAFFLSSFKPLSVMQGKLRSATSGKIFRWGLVVFQFIIAIALISSTIVIYSQMKYIKNKDLGFQIENQLVIRLNSPHIVNSLDVFKDKIETIAGVENITFSTDKPGVDATWYSSYKFGEEDIKEHPAFAMIDVDENFIETMGLQLVEGRNFNPENRTDTGAVIINQAMQRYTGWDNPVGRPVYELTHDFGRRKYTIIGVIKDFNMESLHEDIQPILFKMKERHRYCIVRVNHEKKKEVIAAIEAIWDDLSPSRPFNYEFLNDSYDAEYSSERQFAKIFLYFTLFAIFIACLGIIGLVSFITLSRTKEIGVRKVLGSSSGKVVALITSDFVKMIPAQ
jgi:putative ABC transport system permease protein